MDLGAYLSTHNIDAAKFADRLRVSHEAVRLWLNGDRIPRPSLMAQITKATNGMVTANDFHRQVAKKEQRND